MNQLFVFTEISDIPKEFSKIRFVAKSIDKNLIGYSIDNFGKDLIICLPTSLIKIGIAIRKVYPFDIPIGIVDEISRLNVNIINDIKMFDFIVLLADSVDNVIASRRILKHLSKVRREFKRYVSVKISRDSQIDDLALFLSLSKIYDFRPVLWLTDDKCLELINEIVEIRDRKFCETKWFSFDVQIYYVKDPRVNDPLTAMRLNEANMVELLTFEDLYAFLCRLRNEPSITSIIKYIYDSSRPLMQIGDIVISEEFVIIAETIQRYGSIRSTSKSVGIPYTKVRKIISDLKRLEKSLGVQLLEVRRGGAEHGKTSFTHLGNIVVNIIKNLYGELVKEYSKRLNTVLRRVDEYGREHSCVFPLLI